MGKLKVLMLVVLAAFFAASTCYAVTAKGQEFRAKLTPKEELKHPKSKAYGTAEFRVLKDGRELHYKIFVKDLKDPSAAHIHVGKKGEDGPPIVTLLNTAKKGNQSGLMTEGTLTDKDLMGTYQGKHIEDLVNMMKSGDTYVNVHTADHPEGEIRGQIHIK
jgi:hypothetical protein